MNQIDRPPMIEPMAAEVPLTLAQRVERLAVLEKRLHQAEVKIEQLDKILERIEDEIGMPRHPDL